MLVLTRKLDESIQIGDDIKITVLRIKGNTIRLGIEAPRDVRVVRSELTPLGNNHPGADSDRNGVSSASTVTAIVDSPTIAGPRLYVGRIASDGGICVVPEAIDGDASPAKPSSPTDPKTTRIAPLRHLLRQESNLTAV